MAKGEGQSTKKRYKIFEKYLVLLFIITLLMSAAYAQVSDIDLAVSGEMEAVMQDGMFISSITYNSSINADIENSKINYYAETMFSSIIILGDSSNSSITYDVDFYNNSQNEYIFLGVVYDEQNSDCYDNENIKFEVEGIEKYKTKVNPGESINCQITFSYKNGVPSDKTLNSYLNFKFKEVPKFMLSNNGETYTIDSLPLEDMKEYTFTVSNTDENDNINNVPTNYQINLNVEDTTTPMTLKLFDSDNKGIQLSHGATENIQLKCGEKEEKTYKLQIINEGQAIGENIEYNISVNAVPEKGYDEYIIEQGFKINIGTEIESIEVKTLPDKITYKVGEQFDPKGMVITAKYTDGFTKDITEGYELSKVDTTTPGDKTITITYQNKTATITAVWTSKVLPIEVIPVDDKGDLIGNNSDIGREVRIGNEYFFVIENNNSLLTLITKYSLSTKDLKQENNENIYTNCEFAYDEYWEDSSTAECWDLNLVDPPAYDSNDAIAKARNYGNMIGGRYVIGRLPIQSEIEKLLPTIPDIIYGKDYERGQTSDNCLMYWLATVAFESDRRYIYILNGNGRDFEEYLFMDHQGSVRPIIEIIKI